MLFLTDVNDRPGPGRQLALWWQNWTRSRRTVAELDRCGPSEFAHVAHDLGVSGADLRALAGKWPESADPLLRRMEESKLDVNEVKRVEPQVVRDLQRVCTLCMSKRKCTHDLATNPSDPAWQKYCPNTTTLQALIAERANSSRTTEA